MITVNLNVVITQVKLYEGANAAQSVSAGGFNTCVVTTLGHVQCCGQTLYGVNAQSYTHDDIGSTPSNTLDLVRNIQ